MELKLFFSVTILIVTLTLPIHVTSSRILLLPFPWGSHVPALANIGTGLIDMGHDVYIILPDSFPYVDKFTQNNITVLKYFTIEPNFKNFNISDPDRMWNTFMHNSPKELMRTMDMKQVCRNILSDESLLPVLADLNFDLAITDAFGHAKCYMLLLYRLDIPYASFMTQYEPWLIRNLALPSFVHFPLTEPMNYLMTFSERLRNTWTLIDWSYNPYTIATKDAFSMNYAPEKPAVSMDFLSTRSLLWLVDTDVAIDYARPKMPNEINIGGSSLRPAQPLPENIHKIVEAAENGAVIVCFGSIDYIPQKYINRMMEAFTQLDHLHFLWRYPLEFPSKIPSHITLLKWLPQNDILAHPKTRLFVTHGGVNSQFESVYHAVPMVTFPLTADQPYNAKRAEHKGVSLTVNIHSFTVDELVNKIREVTTDTTYQEKIDLVSEIYRDQPMTARERAAYWVDHVLEFGADHLRSAALDMPWYQYLMLDIIATLLMFITLIIVLMYKLTKMICRRIAGLKLKLKNE